MGLPIVLLYNMQNEKGEKIKLLCAALKIKSRDVSMEQYNEKIAALAGLMKEKGESYQGEETFEDEMMIMANFNSALLDTYLKGFKKYKIPGIGLKAVMTLKNSEWNSVKLHTEIKSEHEAMKNAQSKIHHSPNKKRKK